jgi:aminoglycoside phosphotransferase (APT) family kinase protein
MTDGTVSGIDPGPVTAWLAAHDLEMRPPLRFDLIAGGHSNLTYRVVDTAGRAYALRRPPLGHVLATAHDMGREHRIMHALQGTPVPVPPLVGLCDDVAVNGAPFYVMRFVEGTVVRDRAVAATVDPAIRRTASASVVDVLAAIHAVDVDAVGLGELGRKDGYVARQLKRWRGQWEASKTADLPSIEAVHDRLVARIPDQVGAGIVHGDYRLDNCIIAADGSVAAVLDWELCTLGDTMADLAQLLAYWAEPDDDDYALESPPTAEPGYFTRAEVIERYATQSGRDLSNLDFYLAFANWKVACIIEGVYARYLSGAMGDKDPGRDVHDFRHRVEVLAARADRISRSL